MERKKRKHELIRGGGPFFLLPEGTGKTAAEIRGVTAEENTWSHIGNYKVGKELKDGDPAWDLISFKIKSTLEYKHWSTIFPPSKPPFPVSDTSTCLHTLLIWPPSVSCRPPDLPGSYSMSLFILSAGRGRVSSQFLPVELPPISCSFLPILLP